MRGLPCTVLLALVTVLVACDEDAGGIDAASEPDGAEDPGFDADAMSEPASDPAADPEPETTVDPAPDTAPDPGTDSANAGCVARDTPGCGGCACESCVCEIEPHCCTLFWDDPCVWDCEFICGEEC